MAKNPFSFVATHWFLISLCMILLVGISFADWLQPLSEQVWLRNTLVVSVLFVTTLPVRFEGIRQMIQSPWGVLTACVVTWVLIPLMTLPLVKWRSDALGLGLMVVAAAPGTLASAAVWTRKASGNELIPIGVTLVTNPLSCLVIPFWLGFVTQTSEIQLDPKGMSLRLVLLVVLPMAFAQLVRQRANVAAWAQKRQTELGVFAQLSLLTIVLIGAIQSGLQLASLGTRESLAAILPILPLVIAVHCIALFAAIALSRLLGFTPGDRIGIAFAGSQKTLMVGIQVAFMLGGGLLIIPMVAYHALQLLIDAVLASRWSGWQDQEPTPARAASSPNS